MLFVPPSKVKCVRTNGNRSYCRAEYADTATWRHHGRARETLNLSGHEQEVDVTIARFRARRTPLR